MSGHTPGPWTVSHLYNSTTDFFAQGTILCSGVRLRNQEADARLIAAAPELLAALIDVYANVRSDSPEMWERVTAAIAKATGGQP